MNWADNAIIGLLTQIKDKPTGGTPSGDAAVTDVVSGKTFDSATAGAGATGTLVVPDAPTGDAAVGDVAAGKTFSSATLNGATGTSTKNATVPNDAPIQPAQALVDNFALFVDSSQTTLSCASKGFTKVGGSLVSQWLVASKNISGSAPTVNLSANALIAASVNDILQTLASLPLLSSYAATSVDLSGGTNAVPTDHQDALITLDFTNININNPGSDTPIGVVQGNGSGSAFIFVARSEAPNDNLANTHIIATNGSDTFIYLGVLDSPTPAQIAAKLISIGGGDITDAGTNKVQIRLRSDGLFPYDIGAAGLTTAGIGHTIDQAGVRGGAATLTEAGWTVTTN